MGGQQQRATGGRAAVAVAVSVVAASLALASGPGAGLGPVAARAAGAPHAADPPVPAPETPDPATPDPAAPVPAEPGADPVNRPAPVTPPAVTAPVSPPATTAPAVAPTSTIPSATTPPSVAPAAPAFGAYLDYGPRGVARIAELSRWLGGAELRVGHTYLPGDRWSNIEGAPGFLDAWAGWRRAKDDRLLVLNVPMLERNEGHVPDDEVRALLREGASGAYDRHFRALAERLVALKVPDTVIVLGWEMNGITYTHRCGPEPEAWKTYWNRIVTAMRSVPGQNFRFDFTPNRGRDAIPWTECYPGDDTVDIIGMDAYDQPQGLSFDEQVREPYGLKAHVDFAKSHGKAISYPEWGLFRNGDNATYMRRMLAWMNEHKAVYNTLTDYCPHGVWQCDDNPRAAEVYRSLLSGGSGTAPEPTAPPAEPPASKRPGTCAPVRFGEWLQQWFGDRFCLRFDRWSRHW
ncbi:glycosyl hydrolase [Streptomyces sp. NPDC059785]|uniref:glycosyl hydrolase n=1 Tax=unclassified Streptomyces TaxID=2593676 RepID=UPI0036462B80